MILNNDVFFDCKILQQGCSQDSSRSGQNNQLSTLTDDEPYTQDLVVVL